MTKPRNPTQAEIGQLVEYVLRQAGQDTPDQEEKINAKRLVESASMAVFDNYAADAPGYAGKLMAVVWPSSPEMYEVYIWRNEAISGVKQDEALQSKANGGTVAGDGSNPTG